MRPQDLSDRAVDGLHRQIVEGLDRGVYIVDRDRTIRYWNDGAAQISGHVATGVVGSHCFDNILDHVDETGRPLCFEACPLVGTMEDGQPREAHVFLRHRDGYRLPVRVRATPIRDEAGTIVGAAEVFDDARPVPVVADEVDELRRMAFADELTGLPNRRQAERVIATRLQSLARHGWAFGLLVADLDGLKQINDSCGHAGGDVALQVVARTLGNVRAEDFVARWGGDEFIVVVSGADSDRLAEAAARLGALVGKSRARCNGRALSLAISIGGTLARPDDTLATIFSRADQALYRAKADGRNRFFLDGDGDGATISPRRRPAAGRRNAPNGGASATRSNRALPAPAMTVLRRAPAGGLGS